MGHLGFSISKLTKGWSTVKKLFVLILAVVIGATLVSAPMGCQGTAKDKDKAAEKDKAAATDKDKAAPADKDKATTDKKG
jgi:hypothetical protein